MSVSATQLNLVTTAYSFLRGSGFLRTSLGKRLFRSAYFFYKQHIEDDLQDLVRNYPALLQAGNVLDIGANIGYTSSVLARAVERGYSVYAFEPEPFNYALLQEIANEPEFKDRILPRQCAVGANNGTVDLWLNSRHPADHRVVTEAFRVQTPRPNTITVPLVSIDSFLENDDAPVCFIKLDVQGYELQVCHGMERTLTKNPNLAIVLEYSPSAMETLGFEPSHLLTFLTQRGFKIYSVAPRGRLSPGVTPINNSEYIDLLFTRHSIV